MERAYNLITVAATHYTGALVKDAVESESVPGLRGDGNGCIKNIILKTTENLAWQLELYDKDGDVTAYHTFKESDGYQVNGSGYFIYGISDVDWAIPLTIPNITVEIGLRNLSESSKTAGTDGAVVLKLVIVKG
jgi:hypothetical protein